MFSTKRLHLVVFFIVILSVVAPFSIGEVHAAPDLWSIETVDPSENDIGFYTSLALDANGYPHISYGEAVGNIIVDLKYAQWTGSGWAIETVDYGGLTDVEWEGDDTSLALDSNGYPHIAYFDAVNLNLKYARWTGSEWMIETVDSGDRTGFYMSLALDLSDNPHISYQNRYWDEYYEVWYYQLRYAWWTGSSWEIDTIDSGDAGWYTSLALDANGYPHISYYDSTNNDLKYAWWSGTNWNIDLVDSGGVVGWSTSLALDSSDYPHISYYDYDLGALKYAQWMGTYWEINIIDSNGYVGERTSLALDSNDRPHISYRDEINDALKYARWTGIEWSIETLASIGIFGRWSSLSLDAADHPHIGYYDGNNNIVVSEGQTSTSGGDLSGQCYFPNYQETAGAGIWHAVVYKDSVASPPPTYVSDDPDGTVEDSFEVTEAAIPEFPTAIAGITVAALCFGIYFWMRKRG